MTPIEGPLYTSARSVATKTAAHQDRQMLQLPIPDNSKERVRLRLYLSILLADLACVAIAFFLANYARFGDLLAKPGLTCIPITALLFAIFAFSGKAYGVEGLQSPLTSATRGMRAVVFAAATLVGVFFSMKASAEMSRTVLVSGFALCFALIGLTRYLLGRSMGERHDWNFIREVVILDGFAVTPRVGQIVLVAERSGLSPSLNDPVAHDRLGRFLSNCDRIILACDPSKRSLWGEALKGAGVPVEVLTPELDDMGALALRYSDGKSCVLIAPGPMALRDRLLKRMLDLAIAVPAIIVLLPVFLLIALAISLTSRGPVFFRQPRIGQANRHFDVLKFRTMRQHSLDTAGTRSTSKGDARITPVGRLLRRTSLDELPQLLNVLKGEMSIVGPRPHALGSTAEDQLFWDIDGRYWQRGSVKPGMTGLAQVRGFRGATDRTEDLTNRLHADLEYLADWSIWKDIVIIFKTARVLVHPKAY